MPWLRSRTGPHGVAGAGDAPNACMLEIEFRDLPRTPNLEATVQQWAKKLVTTGARITRCDVVIEVPHRHHRHGNAYHVRVEVAIPEQVLVAEHDHADVYLAVADAFLAMRR